MGEHRLTGLGSPLPKSGACFYVAWKEFFTPFPFHRREQLSHSTCQGRTGDTARTTTCRRIALSIAKRGRIHWVHHLWSNFTSILPYIVLISYKGPRPEGFYYSSSGDKKQSQKHAACSATSAETSGYKKPSSAFFQDFSSLRSSSAGDPTAEPVAWVPAWQCSAPDRRLPRKTRIAARELGNPTRLLALSEAVAGLLFASSPYPFLTESFAVPTGILQVCLN